jgi:hypothetical protein
VKSGAAASPASTYTPRRLAALAFGLVGMGVGVLSGLNSWVQPPATLTSVVDENVWTGAMLGQQHLNVQNGIQAGLLGLIVGRGAALSLGLSLSQVALAWLLGALGLVAGYALDHSYFFAAVGCFLGYSAVLYRNRLPA